MHCHKILPFETCWRLKLNRWIYPTNMICILELLSYLQNISSVTACYNTVRNYIDHKTKYN